MEQRWGCKEKRVEVMKFYTDIKALIAKMQKKKKIYTEFKEKMT